MRILGIKDTDNWGQIAWYPDGQSLSVFTSKNELLKVGIWSGKKRIIAKNIDDAILIHQVINPQGEQLAGAFGYKGNYPGYIRIWDTRTGKILHTLRGEEQWVNGVTYSSDGKFIVTTSMEGPVRVWNANSGASLRVLTGHTFVSSSPVFSPDGSSIATSSADATIRIWDNPTKSNDAGVLQTEQKGYDIFYHPSGKQFMLLSDDSLCLYDAMRTTWERTLYKQASDTIYTAKYSPKGDIIALAFTNQKLGLLNAVSKKLTILGNGKRWTWEPSFTSDGNKIAFASVDSIIQIWDVKTAKRTAIIHWPDKIRNASFIDDITMFVATDSLLSVWNIKDSTSINSWRIPKIDNISSQISPDKKYVITSSNNLMHVWEISTGKQVSLLEGHTSYVYDCEFSPNGKYVVSSSHDTTVKLWDWKSGICLHSEELDQYHYLRCSPDGRHVALSAGIGRIRIWEYPSLQELIDQTRKRFKNRQLTPEERQKYYLE